MPLMGGCGALRLRSQRVEEPCGSRSISSVLSPTRGEVRREIDRERRLAGAPFGV